MFIWSRTHISYYRLKTIALSEIAWCLESSVFGLKLALRPLKKIIPALVALFPYFPELQSDSTQK